MMLFALKRNYNYTFLGLWQVAINAISVWRQFIVLHLYQLLFCHFDAVLGHLHEQPLYQVSLLLVLVIELSLKQMELCAFMRLLPLLC